MAKINPISLIGKPLKWVGNEFQKNPEKAIGISTVASIVVKDGVGCYKYVTQSLKNDKIPEDKRGFVAALDLTNGVLMIAAQIAMFFAMRKYSGRIFEKIFKKSFNPSIKQNWIERFRMQQKRAGITPDRKMKLSKNFDKVKDSSLGLFKFVLDIAAATIVGKRIIVPFIATPLAGKVKEKMEAKTHKKDKETADQETKKVKNDSKKVQVEELKSAKNVDDDDHDEDDD